MPDRKKILASALLIALALLPVQLAATEGKVNINTATAEELSLLPRVGAVVAQRIIEFREKNGKFKSEEDLLLVSGIGDRTYDLIAPYVSLNGETTLKEKVASATKGDG